MIEQVLGVSTDLFHKCGYFEGFSSMAPRYHSLFAAANQEFRPRPEAEQDPQFKQLIPYLVVMRRGLVLNYFRGKGQGEERLRGKRSCGIGGHINPCDLTDQVIGVLKDRPSFLDDKYVRGMLRELHEELRFGSVPTVWDMPIIGLINEDQTNVGRVHLGVVHLLRLDFGQKLAAREADVLDLDWHTLPALLQSDAFDQFERWSQIVLPSLLALSIGVRPKKNHATVSSSQNVPSTE